jgi:hypothetical protein
LIEYEYNLLKYTVYIEHIAFESEGIYFTSLDQQFLSA